MEYVLLVLSPLLVSIKTLAQGRFTKRNYPTVKQSFFFVSIFSLIAALILGAIYIRGLPSLNTLIFGLIMGIATSLFQVIYLAAFKRGPISISGTIISLSILLPTIYGLAFLNESITASKIIGIILTISSLIVLNINKKTEKINILYLILIFIAFILNGSINILQSAFNYLDISNERNYLLFISYLTSFVFSLILAFVYKPKEKLNYKFDLINLFYPILIGTLLAVQNILLMYLLTIFGASIYFPVSSALNIVFITLFGLFIFKDKIKTTQIIGIVLSIVSIVIINLIF